MNFLEQLAAEWYEYKGYFVRTNIRTRLRTGKGGYDGEIDVLAFSPKDNSLIHIEASGDADTWTQRKERFLNKKFILDDSEYEIIVDAKISTVKKVVIVGYTKTTKESLDWGANIEVKLIPNFIREITSDLSKKDPMKKAVPEGYPILRSMQMALAYHK